MKASESISKLAAALSKAQASMGGAVKDASNPFFKSNYADLGSVVKAVKSRFGSYLFPSLLPRGCRWHPSSR